MGLYDDNDENVSRPAGGWAAASQKMNKFQQNQAQPKRDLQR